MNKYLEKKQQEQKAQRHRLAIRASAPAPARSSQESIERIKLNSFYEIDHSKLPHPTTPERLKSIRVVKESEKTLSNVSVRFPSLHSLQTHLNEESYENTDGGLRKQLPELDEKYSMSPAIASEVLCRRLPDQEITEQSKTSSFWAVRRRSANPKSPSSPGLGGGVMSPSPCSLSSEIKRNGMVQWGNSKRVPFRSRHESPSSAGTDEEGKREIEETEIDEEDDKAQQESPYELRRRKKPQKTPKTAKRPKQNTQSRWPTSRYKSAEEHVLNVMKAQGVSAENPILRAPLRSEARKLIGDTGLIDHLLKHMAGKVAPGGADRFRRRHNADGALEYWLESADLVSIRKEAGVEDPYWTPPLGWKIGDDPTQDPTCARMFKEIWEEIANVKREGEFKQQKDLAIVTTSNQSQANSSVIHEDKYTELAVKKSRIEEQMVQLSQSFSGIEEEMKSLLEEMRVLKPTMEDSAFMYSESAEVPLLVSDSAKEMGSRDKANMENKAAKIERLRSSFRICKPQGTFMWPNMSMSPKGVVQQTDSLLVPTPPSDSFSNKSETHLVLNTPNGLNPGSPLKPLPERQAVNISTLSNIMTPQSQIDSISVGKTRDINLNEFPDDIDSAAMME